MIDLSPYQSEINKLCQALAVGPMNLVGSPVRNDFRPYASDWSEYDYGGYKTELELEKGFYDIRIDFSENQGDAYIKFSWNAEGISKGVVPTENLFHAVLQNGGK